MNRCGLRCDLRPTARVARDKISRVVIPLVFAMAATAGCSSVPGFGASSTTQPAAKQTPDDASHTDVWEQISAVLGKTGQVLDGVYTITFPRDDLSVSINGMSVPTAAGIASTFRFYQCSCGKTVVLGEFVLPDYEANDVAYALQKQDILVSSMGPYLLYEEPRLRVVRFQAEGQPRQLARAIKSALDWTGKNRVPPPQKLMP